MTDVAYLPAHELARMIRDRKIGSLELLEHLLARVERHNPSINAVVTFDLERARARALDADAALGRGELWGPFHGLPMTVKEAFDVAGLVTSWGSPLFKDNVARETQGVVGKLVDAGAIVYGKTNVPVRLTDWQTFNPLFGTTNNPYDTARAPGGSSGGAAAALAAGMGALAIGSDGGGSIRIPCGFTGVFGIKAQFGRVPAWPPSAMGTLSHVGPMARSVADAALMLTVTSEPDPRDWASVEYVKHDYSAGLDRGVKGLRVAFSPDLGYAKVHPEVAAVVARAAQAFEDLGAYVEQVDPGFADPTEDFRTLWWAGAAGAMGDLPPARKALLEPPLAELVEEGLHLPAVRLQKAMNARFALGTHMRLFHQNYDLLLTPALAVPAFDVGILAPEGWEGPGYWLNWTPFSYPFNMTQQPACSVPCGFTDDKLPVGLQIVADTYREDLVLRAAAAFEATQPAVKWPGQA